MPVVVGNSAPLDRASLAQNSAASGLTFFGCHAYRSVSPILNPVVTGDWYFYLGARKSFKGCTRLGHNTGEQEFGFAGGVH